VSLYPSYYPADDAASRIADASNLHVGGNPAYGPTDFLGFYPMFTALIPDAVLLKFIAQANAKVSMNRWHTDWEAGMQELIAHYCVMYLQKVGPATAPTAASVIAAGNPTGLQSSKSVGSISVSYTYTTVADEFKGWGDLGLTKFGRAYVTLAKPLCKGGIYVY
jgi:hypothetical protein